jgi:uncharacterized membrane protein YdjX (TVP38/TMEM64 family)
MPPVWLWICGAIVLTAIAFAVGMLLPVGDWIQAFGEWTRSFGALGVVVFAVGYVLGVVLLVPGAPMTLAAALAYGWWAVPLVFVTGMTGAMIAFLLSRFLIRSQVRAAIEDHPNIRAAAEAVDDEGWKVLTLLRLSPAVPYSVQNYVIGITHVRFLTYVAATAVGIIPGLIVNVYVGVLGSKASEGAAGMAGLAMLVAGLIATVLVTWLVTHKARAKLKQSGVKKKKK